MPPLGENGVERWLKQERNVAPDTAQVLSKMSYGDPGLALDYLENRENLKVFAEAFVSSMKISFKKDFHGLHDWVEDLGSWGRGQTQEYFSFCAALISQIAKYKSIGGGAVMLDWFPEVPFKTEGFSRILKYNSLPTIMSVYDEGKIDVGRNLNSKIILFDNIEGQYLYYTIRNSAKILAFHGMMTNLGAIEYNCLLYTSDAADE